MINIKFKSIKKVLKIKLFLLIATLIMISIPEISFSKDFNKYIKYTTSPEEKLAIKFCDSINKNIFNGLEDESILKYEYFFSSLNTPLNNNYYEVLKDFKSNVNKICSYKLNDKENKEFTSNIKKFIKDKK